MTTRRVQLLTAGALAAALVAAAPLPTSSAQEKPAQEQPADHKPAQPRTAREQVRELLPRLRSSERAVRERAEAELFGLGDTGRREMERLARSKDASESSLALGLLQSDRWAKEKRAAGELREGEQPLRRVDDVRVSELQAEIERSFESARKRIEDALRTMPEIELPDFEIPKIEWPDIDWSEVELPRIRLRAAPAGSVSTNGVVSRDGRTLEWSLDADGKTTVSVKDGDAGPRTYEAESVVAFRAAHPELARELDETIPSWTGGPTLRIIGGLPEIEIHQDPRATPPRLPPPVPVLGVGFDTASDVLCHHLGIDAGVVVTSVLRNSAAERLGLRPMDVVISLSGRPVSSSASIRSAMREIADGELSADVIRRGKRITLRAAK